MPADRRDGRLRLAALAIPACAAILAAPHGSALASPRSAPVLDLEFKTMPHWRHGPMPWPPVAEAFDDPSFTLSAGLMSGLRPAIDSIPGDDAAWGSLSNEEEAYPDGDALRLLHINPYSIQGNALEISASPMPAAAEATLPSDMVRPYLSGALNTYPFSQTFGYFEITARVPAGAGLWPAFWLLPVSQAWPPEIDVTEILGNNTHKSYSSLHSLDTAWYLSQPDGYNGNTVTSVATTTASLSNAFHKYAVDWRPSVISFYLDDKLVGTRPTPSDMRQPFYIVVDLAVGGANSWPGPPTAATRFPAHLDVRSIKVWKLGSP